MTIYCKICGNHTVSNWGEVCWRCQNRQREAHEATLRQAEAAEDAAEYQRQAAAAAEEAAYDAAEARRLAAEVHYTCWHCTGSFAKSQGYAPSETEIGKPLCSDCYSLVKKCYGCGKIIFKNSNDCVKLKTIYHRKKDTKEIVPHDDFYACRDCNNNNLGKEQKWFDIQEKRKKEYNDQLAAEKARRQKEERETEQRRQAEIRRKQAAAQLAAEQAAENKKKDEKNYFGGCFGVILLFAALGILGYHYQMGWAIAGGVGITLAVISFLLRSLTSKLFAGLIIAAIFDIIFGLIISGVFYFMWGEFITPLIACTVIFFILGTILYAAGVLDKKK